MLIYLVGALGAGSFWLGAFLLDQTTPKTDIVSWAVLAIATATWPISVTLACLEMLGKARRVQAEKVVLLHFDEQTLRTSSPPRIH